MSIPRVTNALSTVSQLDDRPNDTGGLTAAELKAKFDKDSETLKAYINNTLIPYLESSLAAAQLGVATIPGFSAADIQTALEQIAKAMQDVTQGTVADGSITLAKLAEEVINAIDDKQPPTSTLGALTNVGQLIAASAVAFFPLNLSGVDYRVSLAVMMQALKAMMLGNKSIATAQLQDAVVTSEKLAALAVLSTHIAPGAVTAQKLAADAVKLTFTNVVVQTSQWGSPTAYEDFPYYAQIPLDGITSAMIPEVIFSPTDAISGIFAPTAFSYDGFIHILASEQPSAAITIPTIILWR